MRMDYEKGSLSLTGAVAMGTGVMIGAGIFALTGQVAEFAGRLFPLAFVIAAIISGFSRDDLEKSLRTDNHYGRRGAPHGVLNDNQ